MTTEEAEKDDTCDHQWKLQDDSFDHEFGTERVVFWECQECMETKECSPSDFQFEEPDEL